MSAAPGRLVILGGGTAGWMAAMLFNQRWGERGAISWHCMLAGYGNFPDSAKLVAPGPDTRTSDMAAIQAFVAGCASNYPSHQAALASLAD